MLKRASWYSVTFISLPTFHYHYDINITCFPVNLFCCLNPYSFWCLLKGDNSVDFMYFSQCFHYSVYLSFCLHLQQQLVQIFSFLSIQFVLFITKNYLKSDCFVALILPMFKISFFIIFWSLFNIFMSSNCAVASLNNFQ